MRRKITTGTKEYVYRKMEFNNKIIYIKSNNKDLTISYDSKFIKNLMGLYNNEFDNLLMILTVLAIIYRDLKLKEMKFILQENILILILKNHYYKKVAIIIDLWNKEKIIIICDIEDIKIINNLETII